MASKVSPLPVSVGMVLGEMGGMQRYVDRVAQQGRTTTDILVRRYIRKAQAELEEAGATPFFATRYCTPELATQGSLVQGTDFDELCDPHDYDVQQWVNTTGRTELRRMPVNAITLMRLTLQGNGQIANIPTDWLNVDRRKGIVHLMPHALSSLTGTFFISFGLSPVLLRPNLGQTTPLMIHFRYTAGLCERTAADGESPFDPEEEEKHTVWPQHEVQEYQQHLASLASAYLVRAVAPEVVKAGVSISVDGLNRQANSGLLKEVADGREAMAKDYGRNLRRKAIGVGAVFA